MAPEGVRRMRVEVFMRTEYGAVCERPGQYGTYLEVKPYTYIKVSKDDKVLIEKRIPNAWPRWGEVEELLDILDNHDIRHSPEEDEDVTYISSYTAGATHVVLREFVLDDEDDEARRAAAELITMIKTAPEWRC